MALRPFFADDGAGTLRLMECIAGFGNFFFDLVEVVAVVVGVVLVLVIILVFVLVLVLAPALVLG